ncbi:LytR/AlgR family response regulator transcription factor [Marinicella sp. W31]|uniref:LytR/AlgR family response regulator transcription factor n=1 Tax=Marinicella sp. W31 TaxID=3023713 RepID=UPI0037582475
MRTQIRLKHMSTMLKLSIMAFIKMYGKFLWLPMAVWTGFIVFDLAFTWQFQGELFNKSGFLKAEITQLSLVYYSWMLITFLLGLAIRNQWISTQQVSTKWMIHTGLALTTALLHLLLVTWSFWWFKPVGPSFSPTLTYVELLYKWLIIEVMFYFATAAYWEWVFRATGTRKSNSGELVIKTAQGVLRCRAEQISWMISEGNYVLLYCRGQTYKTRSTLAAMEKSISDGFFRCHRSVLVNADDIQQIMDNRIVLKDGHKLPISQNKKAELMKILTV